MKLIFTKRTPFYIKFLIAIFLAVVLILLDRHYAPFVKLRSYLDSIVSPVYHVINGPVGVLDSLSDMLTNKNELLVRNKALQKELITKNSDLLLLSQLTNENARLRNLLGSPLREDEMKMVTQVLSTDAGPYSDQIVIDKGLRDGVYVGQPVIDEKGVIGQVFAVAQRTSRVILLCDSQHGLPVQVLRNDLRIVALGNGCKEGLSLEFLPNDIDIQIGDILVTSGLDGRFPEGYPVATVTQVSKDVQRGKMLIKATPTAGLNRLRYLLLLWKEEEAESQIKQVVPDDDKTATKNEASIKP